MEPFEYDAVVVGAGPNGLAAAVAIARAGFSVLVVEARDTPGGGCRSGALTLPNFVHDICSAVYPLGAGSPFFRALSLERYGLSWVESPAPLAHVLADGTVVTLERDLEATATQLGRDGRPYRDLIGPFVERFHELTPMVLGPLRVPEHPLLLARFGIRAIRSMRGLARYMFRRGSAPALLAGMAAHTMVPLDNIASSSFALVFAAAGHAVGWPVARGGAQAITDALVACLRAHGGVIELERGISRLAELPSARAYVFDLNPRQLLAIAGERLPDTYRRRLESFRHGPGVYKVDWALRAPIPWRDRNCARAATVHLSGSLDDIAASIAAVHAGKAEERPFVLLAQPSLFDDTRAPAGMHTAWAYCHVPHGSSVDACAAIEAHIERFAPGFKDTILARATKDAHELERYNPNFVGGDIGGGAADVRQLFFRPVARLDPYATPVADLFLCSASTPPGAGVHGMCGYWSAQSVLARFGARPGKRAPA